MSIRFAAPLVALLTLASLAGCTSSTAADPGAELASLADDPEVNQTSDELKSKPKYTVRTAAVLGEYASNDSCAGGFDVCDHAVLRRNGDKLEIALGSYEPIVAEVHASKGVLVFTTGELPFGDCDDPGCGNLVKISGVVYPVAQGSKWVPQVKATVIADFPFPEEEESPEGEVKSVVRMKKQ